MNNKITFKGLGPKEAELVARLAYEKNRVVTVQDLSRMLPSDYKYRNQLIYNLKKKKIITPVKRGVYIFTPLEALPAGPRINEFLIAPAFFPKGNYYIGYSTIFNYYGFTEQLFQTVHVLNTSTCREQIICGVSYKFIKVPESRFYGVDRIIVDGTDVLISSRERTLVDLIYYNKPVGGVFKAVEILKWLVSEEKVDTARLVNYATHFPNSTVRKRIGVVLEGIGINNRILTPLIKSVAGTSITSLTGSRKGTLNKRWRVIIDDASQG